MALYEKLEKKYAEFTGADYAVSCNTGTSALHLALMSVGVGLGDEVICPDFTMAAVGFAVSYTNATPVFVDCDETLNIDTTLIEDKITEYTKAIIVVHTYGRLANIEEVYRIAKKHDLYVIEDACEAQGAVYKSKADVTCYSFYKNKIIHADEGGICTTNSKYLAERMNYLKNMAFDEGHTYYHEEVGYNYRMPDSTAELALKSLEEYPETLAKRLQAEEYWNKLIPTPKRDAVWVYHFLCDNELDREIKMQELKEKGFETRYFFKPLSTMPMWRQPTGKNALDYSKRGMYIIIK